MMVSPNSFLSDYENATYFELLKLKNDLIQRISDFEKDYDMKNLEWGIEPSPDVHYQWNLEVLGKLAPMLQKAFNKEYEWGEKNISDYYKEMRNNA